MRCYAELLALRHNSVRTRHTIRRESDGLCSLVAFHEATGDEVYLRAIRESVFFHKFDYPANGGIDFGPQGVISYLLAQGMQPTEGERDFLKTAAEATQAFVPVADWGDATALDYDALAEITTTKLPPFGSPAYRESAAICGRARWFFYALPWFGAESEFSPKKPL